MANYRSKLLIRRAKNALKILRDHGPREFYNRVTDFVRRKGQINLESRHMSPLEYDREPVHFTDKKIDQTTLLDKLARLKTQPFSLALSQDDYLQVVGGVQLKISDQQSEMNQQGQAYLHLSPYLVRKTLDHSDQPGVMCLNLDGHFVGYVDDETLLITLAALVEDGGLKSIELHHLMGWKMRYVARILELAGDLPIHFWLHDLFSICPNYLLLRNDREYCHAPLPNSNACNLCIYGTIRPLHYQKFSNLFSRYPIQVVAPSDFALELWCQKFPVFTGESQVVPNACLEWGEPVQKPETDSPLRVAFVGYPVLHKGWQAWLNLTNKFGEDPRYKFFHFSLDWQRSPNFEKVSVAVNRQNRTAMTEALRENEIDIAFLWSICPETFSYTLYESLAGGCYIVTNPASGNIQHTVITNPQWGSVFTDEDELLQAFDDGSILRSFEEFNLNQRRTARMIIDNNR